MKRNRNFLLIVWAVSLLGIFAVRDVHGFQIPIEFVVWEAEIETTDSDTTDFNALLSRDLFDAKKLHYDLTADYGSNLLVVAHLWDEVPNSSFNNGQATISVYANGEEVKKDGRSEETEGRKFLTYSKDVYVIPFETDSVILTGVVDATDIEQGTTIYTAVVKRGEANNITALRWIMITDVVSTNGTTTKQDTILKAAAGEDGKLKPEANWIFSFKDSDKDNDLRGTLDTLYFQKFDAQSKIFVIKNGTDTLTDKGNSLVDNEIGKGYEVTYNHIGSETYKVKIDAGNKYTIDVTARNGKNKGYYHVTLLDDTIRKPDSKALDSLQFMLKDIYLYEGDKDHPDRRYTLIADKSGKVGFSEDTTDYKVIVAPWSSINTSNPSIKVGYDFFDKEAFDGAQKEVVVVKYEKEVSGERFIEVRATVPKNSITGKGSNDTTYKIRVLSDDTQLESLRLSSDRAGTKPLELTRDDSTGVYTSAAVDYTTKSVFAWAVVKDTKANVVGSDTIKGEYRQELKLDSIVGRGGQESFDIQVRAEDTTLITPYTVNIKMNWNPSIDSITFRGADKVFGTDTLRTHNVFDVVVPTGINFEDIEPVVEPKKKKAYEKFFRVFKNWQVIDGVYAYIVKVTAKEDGSTKTYTFNLRHPSSDASLSYLAVPGFELDPAFDPAITAYTVIVPRELESVTFVTLTNHEKANVDGGRKHSLAGDSTFRIVVTAEDKVATKTYTVRVTGNTNTGIQLAGGSSVQVYVSNQSLHVSTPAAERVSVYSAGGQLLYSLDKPAGKAFVSTFPKGVLIVKGSSGWVKKVALH